MRKIANFVLIAIGAALIVIPVNAASNASKGKTKVKAVPITKKSTYKIGASDILSIITWKEPDFTINETLVRIDGKISFPLLSDIQAAGLTPLMLRDVIERGLKEYITAPIVTVTVVNPASKKFYILGEVMRTGEYPLVKDLSVLQAFALAGGFTEWASKKEIILMRREDGKRKVIKINYKAIAKGRNLEQNVFVKADDTIIVP
jgi:polysaccharide export outer membrane protein